MYMMHDMYRCRTEKKDILLKVQWQCYIDIDKEQCNELEIRMSHVEKKVPNVNKMHTFAPVNIIPACCSFRQIFQHIFKILRHFKTGY